MPKFCRPASPDSETPRIKTNRIVVIATKTRYVSHILLMVLIVLEVEIGIDRKMVVYSDAWSLELENKVRLGIRGKRNTGVC